jgi:hypothetical protein
MRENRLSGSEGGAILIPSSLPLSINQSLRDGNPFAVPYGTTDSIFFTTNHHSPITNHDSFRAGARSNDVRISLMAWSMSASDFRKKLIQPLSGKI